MGRTFLTLGIAFLAIGFSGRAAFVAIGAAFFGAGIALLIQEKRSRKSK